MSLMITRKDLIKKYIEFFKSKNHKEIANSSLIPDNDPTVLFTTAGMHPLVPFLLGQKHPQGKRLVGVQKCIRTGDIEEVGDNSHHTFFEMLGNWSLGDYWKKEAIEYSFEFLTQILKIPKEELSVTCFEGDKDSPKDTETAKIWKRLGIEKVKFLGKKDNWWGPAGKTGPCGPDTEMFVKDLEIWNDVLMQYEKDKRGNYNEAKQKNIDTGMGVERTLTIINNLEDNYETEVWKPIIKQIEKLSDKKYSENKREMRIIADHLKAAVFILAEGIKPSNTEQGYVLRRLIRRAIRYGKQLGISTEKDLTTPLVIEIIKIYPEYNLLKKNENIIIDELNKEEEKFERTLEKGLNLFSKLTKDKKHLTGKESFLLFQSYGFPIEMTLELSKEKGIKTSKEDFEEELKNHQKLSQTATKGKFKSGLADHSEKTTKLHTSAHLLLAALKKVLKDSNISQKGSNINPERLRLDFSFDRKLTGEEISEVEKLVNDQIKKEIPVSREEMTLEEAKKQGAEGAFEEKYKGIISVYTVGDFSKEICTGPHVKNTKEIGKFKIKKQESCGAGVRRIKAIIQ
ncbi:MAG: alanine--tRNA ligase [Nanoarchaeota archaeon]|nr:alanine--tRNA ligase [Nanoarchaeota archaeon]